MISQLVNAVEEAKFNHFKELDVDDGLDNGLYAEYRFLFDVIEDRITAQKICPSCTEITFENGNTISLFYNTGTENECLWKYADQSDIHKGVIEFARCIGAVVSEGEVVAVLPRFLLEVG